MNLENADYDEIFTEACRLLDIARTSLEDITLYSDASKLFKMAAERIYKDSTDSNCAESERLYWQALSTNSEHEAERCLGNMYYEQHELSLASKHFNKADEFNNRYIIQLLKVIPLLEDVNVSRVSSNLDRAKFIQKQNKIWPDILKAREAFNENRYADALDLYRRIERSSNSLISDAQKLSDPSIERIQIGNYLGMIANQTQSMFVMLYKKAEGTEENEHVLFSNELGVEIFRHALKAYHVSKEAFRINPEWSQYLEKAQWFRNVIEDLLKLNPDHWDELLLTFEGDESLKSFIANIKKTNDTSLVHDNDKIRFQNVDVQDLPVNRTSHIPHIEFEDGTNIPKGTKFSYQISKTTTWYTPRESVAPANWQQQWNRLKSEFENFVFQCRPIECKLLQTRVPGYTQDSHPVSSKFDCDKIRYSFTGMSRDVSRLYSADGISLFSDYQILDAQGKPICNTANDAYGIRFGLHRQYFFFSGPNWANERREFPGPELHELEKECSRLLYQLPAHVSESLWKNWPEGFDRRQNSNRGLWFDSMFELAWQGKPGDRIHAERYTPTTNGSVGLKGKGLFPTVPKDLESLFENLHHEYGNPIWITSSLDDIVRVSIAAIDELLERAIPQSYSQSTAISGARVMSQSKWLSLNGLPDKKRKFVWTLTSEHSDLNDLPEGEGLRIQIHLLDRPESSLIAFIKAKELIEVNHTPWIIIENQEWRIDLEKLLDLYPETRSLKWLSGIAKSTPVYIHEPIGITSYNRPFRSTVVFYIRPDNISIMQRDDNIIEEKSLKLDSDIVLESRKDSGFYGIVWKGYQTSLKRNVAVKIIKAEREHYESAIQHAQALARLQHENIVTVYHIAKVCIPESDKIVDAVIMEWLEGETLETKLSGETFTTSKAYSICNAILQGLKYIHSKELTHGDLHAGNIFITDNSIKIIDPTYSSTNELTLLSTASKSSKTQGDISFLRYLIRRVLYNSDVDHPIIGKHESRINNATTVDNIQQIVEEIFTHPEDNFAPLDDSTVNENTVPVTPLEKLYSLGLEHSDALFLKYLGEKVLAGEDNRSSISVHSLVLNMESDGITYDTIANSIESLHLKAFINGSGGRHSRFAQISTIGFDAYLRCYYESYRIDFESVYSVIVSENLTNHFEISSRLDLARPFVLHVMDVLEMNKLCTVNRSNDGANISYISDKLRQSQHKSILPPFGDLKSP